jgi:hypothetical protein
MSNELLKIDQCVINTLIGKPKSLGPGSAPLAENGRAISPKLSFCSWIGLRELGELKAVRHFSIHISLTLPSFSIETLPVRQNIIQRKQSRAHCDCL